MLNLHSAVNRKDIRFVAVPVTHHISVPFTLHQGTFDAAIHYFATGEFQLPQDPKDQRQLALLAVYIGCDSLVDHLCV